MSEAERKVYMRNYLREYRKQHREHLLAMNRAWWKKHGWKQNAIRRGQYRNNPDYRAAELARKRKERENHG